MVDARRKGHDIPSSAKSQNLRTGKARRVGSHPPATIRFARQPKANAGYVLDCGRVNWPLTTGH
jgi:hypothetical protein